MNKTLTIFLILNFLTLICITIQQGVLNDHVEKIETFLISQP